MMTFFQEFFITLSVLIAYGLIGGFMMIPFRDKIQFPILASPMAGMLLWAMFGFLFYQMGGLSLKTTILIVGLTCASITISSLIYLRPTINKRDSLFIISLVTCLCALVSYLNNYTSI